MAYVYKISIVCGVLKTSIVSQKILHKERGIPAGSRKEKKRPDWNNRELEYDKCECEYKWGNCKHECDEFEYERDYCEYKCDNMLNLNMKVMIVNINVR